MKLSRRCWLFGCAGVGLGGVLTGCQNQAPPPALGSVGAFSAVDQDNRPVTQAALRGRTWIAAFMFTRCPTICPRITARMREVAAQAKARDIPVHMVSFSVDPEHDQPPVLKEYARAHGADLTRWSFLTGDFETIKRTSIDSFKLHLERSPDAGGDHMGILHGSHLVLVDAGGQIRGYYATNDDEAMKRLVEDAARVTAG